MFGAAGNVAGTEGSGASLGCGEMGWVWRRATPDASSSVSSCRAALVTNDCG